MDYFGCWPDVNIHQILLAGYGGGGGITFINAQSATQNATATTTVTTPTHISGDLLVFYLFNSNATRTISSGPSGATLQITETAAVSGIRVWTKVAGGSEPGTFSVALNSTDQTVLACLSYRGASGLAAGYAFSTATGNPSVTGTFTPATAGVLLSFFGSETASALSVTTPPAGTTNRVGSFAASRNVAGYDLNPSPAGLTSAQSLTWSAIPSSPTQLVFQVV